MFFFEQILLVKRSQLHTFDAHFLSSKMLYLNASCSYQQTRLNFLNCMSYSRQSRKIKEKSSVICSKKKLENSKNSMSNTNELNTNILTSNNFKLNSQSKNACNVSVPNFATNLAENFHGLATKSSTHLGNFTDKSLKEFSSLLVNNQLGIQKQSDKNTMSAAEFPDYKKNDLSLSFSDSEREWLEDSSMNLHQLQVEYLKKSFENESDIEALKYQMPNEWNPPAEALETMYTNARRIQQILSMPLYGEGPKILKRKHFLFTEDIDEYFSVHKRDPSNYCNFIWALSIQGNYSQAFKAYEDMVARGIDLDITIFNSLLVGCRVLKLPEQADFIYDLVKKHGITPDVWFLAETINVYVESNQVDSAFHKYKTLTEKEKIKPNVVVFSNLIKGCLRDDDVDRAWKVYDHMRTWYCEPDTITLNSMIYACAKSSNTEKAFVLYREMKLLNLRPLAETFELLTYACLRRKDYYKQAFELLREMKMEGHLPTIKTLSNLLGVAAKGGDVPTAELIFDEIMSLPEGSASEYPYAYMIEAYTTANRHPKHNSKDRENREKSLLIFERMINQNVKPTVLSLNSKLMVFSKRCIKNRAISTFEEFTTLYNVKPDLFSYNCLIEMFSRSRNMDKAMDAFHLLKAEGLTPTHMTYGLLIQGCARSKLINTGMKLIREMKSKNIQVKEDYPFIINLRRLLSSAPDLIREIDTITGKIYKHVMPWRLPGKRKKIGYSRELTKEERKKSSIYS